MLLPNPHSVGGIYFPPKSYSFQRIKRVIERMIDEAGGVDKDKKWSLAFRDDSFAPEVCYVLMNRSSCPPIHPHLYTACLQLCTA